MQIYVVLEQVQSNNCYGLENDDVCKSFLQWLQCVVTDKYDQPPYHTETVKIETQTLIEIGKSIRYCRTAAAPYADAPDMCRSVNECNYYTNKPKEFFYAVLIIAAVDRRQIQADGRQLIAFLRRW